MAKLSAIDKMRVQTLREQGFGAKAIKAAYPGMQWSLATLKRLCQRIDKTGSALGRKPGSGRPKSARSVDNVLKVQGLICSQENEPGTSLSTRQIAREVGVSQASVRNIAKNDLALKCFKRMPVQVISDATKQKRLNRSTALLQRMTVPKTKRLFFTDEKIFHISPPVNRQNNRVWSSCKKRDISKQRLLTQRAKFSAHVMVSAGVCYNGKGKLHFIDDNAKINAAYYIQSLLPKLFADCNELLQNNFVFQQDGAPAHSAHATQEWLTANSPEFISKDEWPPNSPDLNPLDYHVWGAMLHKYQQYQPKPTNKAELKLVLETIWNELPQSSINKAVMAFRKRLQACIRADGGHFELLLC